MNGFPNLAVKWLSFVLLLSASLGAQAQTINAATCNASDVQKAFNSVTNSTTTVNIPAGNCNWSSQVTLTVPSGNTSLTVQGLTTVTGTCGPGGSCAATDNTAITDNYASDNPLLSITTNSTASAYFRLTGLTFQGGNGLVKYNGIVIVTGSSQSLRVDDNHFNSSTYNPVTSGELIRIGGWQYGVVDHNIFDLISATNGIEVEHDAYGGYQFGDGAWADTDGFGSNRYIYMENNEFSNDNSGGGNAYCNDGFQGGRWIARFNIFKSCTLQTHPTTGTDTRGSRAAEVYDNQWVAVSGTQTYDNFFWDSGTGLVWGNASPGATNQLISLYSDRSSNEDHSETPCNSNTDCSNAWGYCGTNFNGLGSTWDQNSIPSTGYKCLDEPGTGQADLLQGAFPNKCDVTSGQCAIKNYKGTSSNQALSPIYEWADAWIASSGMGCGGNAQTIVCVNLNSSMAQNQDWYNNTQTWNGSAFTGPAFNGTVGTGSGTLALRPSTCTTGVAYWATDQGNWNTSNTPSPVQAAGTQGELFVCSAPNTWTLYYTPYTYPHPLTQGDPPPPPAAPTGLTATVQ